MSRFFEWLPTHLDAVAINVHGNVLALTKKKNIVDGAPTWNAKTNELICLFLLPYRSFKVTLQDAPLDRAMSSTDIYIKHLMVPVSNALFPQILQNVILDYANEVRAARVVLKDGSAMATIYHGTLKVNTVTEPLVLTNMAVAAQVEALYSCAARLLIQWVGDPSKNQEIQTYCMETWRQPQT
jgi:hypothetical protein